MRGGYQRDNKGRTIEGMKNWLKIQLSNLRHMKIQQQKKISRKTVFGGAMAAIGGRVIGGGFGAAPTKRRNVKASGLKWPGKMLKL